MNYFCFSKKILITGIIIFLFIIISIIAISFILINNNSSISNSDDLNNSCPDIDYNETQENLNEENEFLLNQYRQKKLLAITFDDGPSKYTKNLLDELNKRDIKATFFVIGANVSKYSDVLDYINSSNSEIAIHSFVHRLFTRLDDTEIIEQIDKTKNAILSCTYTNISLIRVPYGSNCSRVEDIISSQNLVSVLWDVDSLDWKFRNSEKIYNYVLKKVKGN